MKYLNKTTASILIFVISLIVYIITLAPGLMFTDNGELAGVCVTFGVAHPTGYPLFTILGHLWSLIPFPFSKIYSLNLFSAILVSLANYVFFHIIYNIINYLNQKAQLLNLSQQKKDKANLKNNRKQENFSLNEGQITLTAMSVALMFAFARTIWEQATYLEVYSLQIFIFNLIIWSFIKSAIERNLQQRYLILTALFIALGLANHLTVILVLPALVISYFIITQKVNIPLKNKILFLLLLGIIALFGFSLYIVLIIRSSAEPLFNWGGVSRGFEKFWYHISGKQYQVWMFSGESIARNLKRLIEIIPWQVAWIGLAFTIWGIIYTIKNWFMLFIFLLCIVVFCILYSMNYSINDIDSYFSAAFIGILLFTGIGIFATVKYLKQYYPIVFLFPILSLGLNFTANNNSQNELVPEYTKILIENARPNALIISRQWDFWIPAFWYMQKIEGYRSDVVLIEKELIRRTWFLNQLKHWYPDVCKPCEKQTEIYLKYLEMFERDELKSKNNIIGIQKSFENLINCYIDSNFNKRPIYITADIYAEDEKGGNKDLAIANQYYKIPEGLALRLEKSDSNHVISIDNINLSKFIESYQYYRKSGNTNFLIEGIKDAVLQCLVQQIGFYCQTHNQLQTAISAVNLAISLDPENKKLRSIKYNLEKLQSSK